MCVKACASVYVVANCLLTRTIAVGGGRRRVHPHCKGTLFILRQRTSPGQANSTYQLYTIKMEALFNLVPGSNGEEVKGISYWSDRGLYCIQESRNERI